MPFHNPLWYDFASIRPCDIVRTSEDADCDAVGSSLSPVLSAWGGTRLLIPVGHPREASRSHRSAYGRYTLPAHPPHRKFTLDPAISHTYRRIFIPPYDSFPSPRDAYDSTVITHAEDVQMTEDELQTGVAHGSRWLFYSVWERQEEPQAGWEGGGRGRGRDLVLVHGRGLSLGAPDETLQDSVTMVSDMLRMSIISSRLVFA